MIDERTDEGRGDTDGLHVVLGAGGGTGAAVVRELARRGLPARAVSRAGALKVPDGVTQAAADLTDAAELAAAVEGADVVYHCAQPPYTRWAQEFPPLTQGIAEAAARVGAKLVFADNLYMYGAADEVRPASAAPGRRGGVMTEDSPVEPPSAKGAVRAAMARDLLAAYETGRLRVTIGRSSDYYGPGGLNSAFGARQLKALVAGKKVQWFADLDQPHTLHYLDDMARALVVLGERDEADGKVWHLPAAAPLTGREFIDLAARVAGTGASPVVLGVGTVRFVGLFMPVLREFPELWYRWDRPFVSDASRFEEAFGPFAVTPHAEALRRTVAWYREETGGAGAAVGRDAVNGSGGRRAA